MVAAAPLGQALGNDDLVRPLNQVGASEVYRGPSNSEAGKKNCYL